MKRLAYLLLSALTFTILLSGCKGETNSKESASGTKKTEVNKVAENTKEPINLTFWYSWTDKIQENNENLTKQFNETVGKELGIKVTAQGQGTYDELHQKLQAAYVAGSTPSVTVMEIGSTKTFANNGVIENLSPYIERDNIDMADFYEGLLINCEVDGKWYGLPYLRSTPILYFNKALLEKAGLDTAGPKTWEEFKTYVKTIKEKTGAYGFASGPHVWYYEAFMLQQGSSVLSKDEKLSNINTEESKNIVKFFKELVNEDYIRMYPKAELGTKVKADMMNQNVAMWLNSTADLTYTLQVAEENNYTIGTTYIPKFNQYGVPTGGANLIMTTKMSETEKNAAWEFIKWMTSKEQTAYASAYTGYVPTKKTASETDTIKNLHESRPQFTVALNQLNEHGNGRPMNPGYRQGEKILENSLEKIWLGDDDIDSTLKAAEDQMNAALK